MKTRKHPKKRKPPQPAIPAATAIKPRRRYGSERDVEAITGISARTLQKDRLLNRKRFSWFKVGKKVLYDLDEVEAIIRRTARGEAIA